MNNKRIKYIDYTKGIGILLIVLAHCIQYFEPMTGLNKYVCSFHVPIFFVAAGCLAFYQKSRELDFMTFVKKRAKALLVPYVIFSLVNSAIKFAVLFAKHSITVEAIKGELTELLITGNGTVWFLVTLFGVELVFWFLKKYIKKNINILYSCLCIILLFAPYMLNQKLGNTIGLVLIRIIAGLGFYLLGYLMLQVIENKSTGVLCVIACLLCTAGTIISLFFGAQCAFFAGKFEKCIPSILVSAFLSLGILTLLMFIDKKDADNQITGILKYFGKNSLIVMVIHPTVLLFFTYPLGGYFWEMKGIKSIAVSLALFAVITIIEVPFIWIINTWFPWVLGKEKAKVKQ